MLWNHAHAGGFARRVAIAYDSLRVSGDVLECVVSYFYREHPEAMPGRIIAT